jgi:hypothetical protein
MSSARWLHETLAEYRAESSGASKASVDGGGWFQLPRDPAPEELTKALTNFGARFKTKKLNGEQDPSGILDFFDLFALTVKNALVTARRLFSGDLTADLRSALSAHLAAHAFDDELPERLIYTPVGARRPAAAERDQRRDAYRQARDSIQATCVRALFYDFLSVELQSDIKRDLGRDFVAQGVVHGKGWHFHRLREYCVAPGNCLEPDFMHVMLLDDGAAFRKLPPANRFGEICSRLQAGTTRLWRYILGDPEADPDDLETQAGLLTTKDLHRRLRRVMLGYATGRFLPASVVRQALRRGWWVRGNTDDIAGRPAINFVDAPLQDRQLARSMVDTHFGRVREHWRTLNLDHDDTSTSALMAAIDVGESRAQAKRVQQQSQQPQSQQHAQAAAAAASSGKVKKRKQRDGHKSGGEGKRKATAAAAVVAQVAEAVVVGEAAALSQGAAKSTATPKPPSHPPLSPPGQPYKPPGPAPDHLCKYCGLPKHAGERCRARCWGCGSSEHRGRQCPDPTYPPCPGCGLRHGDGSYCRSKKSEGKRK